MATVMGMTEEAGPVGAILVLGRDLVMVPKLIHPLPPATPRARNEEDVGEALDIEEEPPTPHPSSNTWLEVVFLPTA